ncbi:hypothetical protein GCM10009847_01240 [Leucobacter tardus]|uniref:Ig-like domain repeat protein n=1 Tax=Leucobacter tardus TaxID=501483 RepID=A0A939TSF3_9MICO|nr:Ig-like domain repeat protein [Leucobacter tardus]MBO2991032.1 Ig-like domain repeat protein [Leucobacter tardus]
MKVSAAPRRKVRSLVGAFTSALLVASGLALAPAAANAAPTDGTVADATLDWGFKQSFRSYIKNPVLAKGTIQTLGTATSSAPNAAAGIFSWTGGEGTAASDGTAADVSFGAADGVRFQGHASDTGEYVLDLQLTHPRIVVTSATTAELYVDVRGREFVDTSTVGEWYEGAGVHFADVQLGTPTTNGEVFTWTAAPTTLTEEGAESFASFYEPDEALDPMTFSLPIEEVVEAQETQTTLTASAAKITEGDAVDLSAKVVPAEAAGTVQFMDGDETLGEPQTVSNGAASLRTNDLTLGEHSLTAEFVPSDDSVFTASSSEPVSVTVEKAEEPVAWEPQVDVFLEDGSTPVGNTEVSEGDTLVVKGTGYDPGSNVGGRGVPIPSTLPQGVYVVFGEFAQKWQPSANAPSDSRAIGAQRWALTESTVNSVPAQYQSTVRGQWVELNADGSFEWHAKVADHDGKKPIVEGEYGVYTYPGGGVKNASQEQSVPVNFVQAVSEPVATTTTVAATSAEVTEGDAVTLSATVAPAAASGSVQFASGGSNLGEPVTVANGAAELNVSDLPVGVNVVTAAFNPADAKDFKASTSKNEVKVTVAKKAVADPKISVTPSEDLDPAEEQTLTVTGTGFVGAGAVNGAYVLFGEQSVWAGDGPLPSAGWIAQGWVRPAQIVDGAFSTSVKVPAGSLDPAKTYHVATSAAHGLSVTDRSLDAFAEVTVAQPAPEPAVDTTTTLTVSDDAIVHGDEVELAAQVAPSEAAGTVQFMNDAEKLGKTVPVDNGSASLKIADLPVGAHSLTAEFTPSDADAYAASSSESVAVKVTAKPSIKINGGDSAGKVVQGEDVVFTAGPFVEGETFQVEVRSEVVALGEQTADSRGVVTAGWTVPADFAVGEHAVVFIDATGDELSTTFEVIAADAPSGSDNGGDADANEGGQDERDPASTGGQVGANGQQHAGQGGLANTGSNGHELGLLFAGGAILLGAAGLVLARRRSIALSE